MAVNRWVDSIADAGYNFDPPTYKSTLKKFMNDYMSPSQIKSTDHNLYQYSPNIVQAGNAPVNTHASAPSESILALQNSPTPTLPEESVERLKMKFANKLKNSRYMEQNCEPTTYPGWDGFPLIKCHYSVSDKNGKRKSATVIMLNPSIEQLSRWVVHTCMEVKGSAKPECTDKLFNQIIGQSGGQFPVAGIVFEDIIPPDGINEVYCFRDGVTVRVKGVEHRGTHQPTDEEIKQSLSGEVGEALIFARIQGTTREEYKANGGTADVDGLAWLEVSRKLYQAAWEKDRNELMIAWARKHL